MFAFYCPELALCGQVPPRRIVNHLGAIVKWVNTGGPTCRASEGHFVATLLLGAARI